LSLAPTLDALYAARGNIAGAAIRTPLVRLNAEGPAEIWLKLETLQPIGSFKIRGARNAIAQCDPSALRHGVFTASAGNMGQGVAWCARELGLPCSVVVPDHAPTTKLDALERLGASVIKVPWDRWWRVLVERQYDGLGGHFIHPVADPGVIAGNGTIGLEILEDMPNVSAVVVPYGGGGLCCGIASAVRAVRPGVPVYACEVETAAPLAPALAAGAPVEIAHRPSFVDGMGAKALLPEMWPLARALLAGPIVASLEAVAKAIRLLVERNRVVAEGAGAASVAAALTGRAGAGPIACVISGGNIDLSRLVPILEGHVPV